jgi:hypothetical protein
VPAINQPSKYLRGRELADMGMGSRWAKAISISIIKGVLLTLRNYGLIWA